MPFELNEMIQIPPGSIVLFAGSQDAGKTAIMMNIAKENRDKWNVHYFSSEMNKEVFKTRMRHFPDVSTGQLKNIRFYARSNHFDDVIRTGDGDLNIIDYLEIHDQFYLISQYMAKIHDKLKKAIAVVSLQKDPKALYGRGGSFSQEKPILSVSIDKGEATISKFKGQWNDCNPSGMKYRFKILDGCRLIRKQGWHRPIET